MNEIAEEWRSVVGYEDRYKVSSLGRLRNQEGRILRTFDSHGYRRCTLFRGNRHSRKKFQVHRIVAEAFIGVAPRNKEINHKDGVKNNNIPGNLEWVTKKQQMAHAKTLLTYPWGEKNGSAILTARQAREIRLRRRAGEKQVYLAREFSVSHALIRCIERGKLWKAA